MRPLPLLLLIALSTAAQTPMYLVLLKGGNALGYFSQDGKKIADVPVGQHPHEMVFSADRRLLYTSDNGTMRIENPGEGGNSVSIVDVAGRRVIGRIDLGKYHRPHGLDLDPKTGRLAVTTEKPDRLLLIDTQIRSVVKTYDTKGTTSHMVKFGPGGTWAYVSNSGSATVAAINIDSGETRLIQTGQRPEGSVLSVDGKELYVCNREASAISVIDTTKNQAIANITTGKGPVRIAITPDGKQLVYALMHDRRVGFADPRARQETAYVLLPGEPVSCNLSPDGRFALVSVEKEDRVYVISVADKKIVGEIKTAQGAGPDPVFSFTGR